MTHLLASWYFCSSLIVEDNKSALLLCSLTNKVVKDVSTGFSLHLTSPHMKSWFEGTLFASLAMKLLRTVDLQEVSQRRKLKAHYFHLPFPVPSSFKGS